MENIRSTAAFQFQQAEETFEYILILSFTVILVITMTFMPKTYTPDRWMITGWILYVLGFACAMAGHFLGRFGCLRSRTGAQIAAAACLILGLGCTVVFVSEGDDGNNEDQYVHHSELMPPMPKRPSRAS